MLLVSEFLRLTFVTNYSALISRHDYYELDRVRLGAESTVLRQNEYSNHPRIGQTFVSQETNLLDRSTPISFEESHAVTLLTIGVAKQDPHVLPFPGIQGGKWRAIW